MDLSVILHNSSIGLEGMKDVKSDGSVGDETKNGVVFIDLSLMITMFLDLSALKIGMCTLEYSATRQQSFCITNCGIHYV